MSDPILDSTKPTYLMGDAACYEELQEPREDLDAFNCFYVDISKGGPGNRWVFIREKGAWKRESVQTQWPKSKSHPDYQIQTK